MGTKEPLGMLSQRHTTRKSSVNTYVSLSPLAMAPETLPTMHPPSPLQMDALDNDSASSHLPSSRISVFWCKLSPDPGSEVRLR